jgi:hypothetical protein
MSRKRRRTAGAEPKYSRSYTSSATIQVPVRRQWSSSACCSARVSVQPVGLLGALTSSTRVRGVTAASSSARSSRQAPAMRAQRHPRDPFAPRIAGCAVRLGHTGTTATTSSPAPASICIASISAFTPDEVTATRSTSIGHAGRLV